MRLTPAYLAGRATNGLLGTLIGVETGENVTALTFDDGPDPEYTPRLLEILGKHGARATFFMLGEKAARHPELVRRVAKEGHAIGNHTWNHPSMPFLNSRARFEQWNACASALGRYGTRLYRPPYGHQSPTARIDALRNRYTVVGWTGHVEDWRWQPVETLAHRIAGKIVRGGILLLHDAIYDIADERASDRTFVLSALDRVIDRLKTRYRFVTVPELLRYGRPVRVPWYKRGDDGWLQSTHTTWSRFYAMPKKASPNPKNGLPIN